MKKNLHLILFVFIFFYIFPFNFIFPQASNSSTHREFNRPKMEDGSKPPRGSTEFKRLKRIEKALKNISDKIKDKNSDINKKFSDCVKDALGNLFEPDIEVAEYLSDDMKSLKVTLSSEAHPDDKNSSDKVLMQVARKSGSHPNVNADTYHGVWHGKITIYPEAFQPKYSNCLEGNLFHEVLHLACFTNTSNFLGEKIAYACSHKIYKCASAKNPDDKKDDDYSNPDECTEENCKKEKKDRTNVDETRSGKISDTPDDNYSVADGVIKESIIESDFLIYRNGSYFDMDTLCGGIYFYGSESPKKLLEVSKAIIIPSGGLANLENDSTLRLMLQDYVMAGGTLLVLSQQYDTHIENLVPVPEGENIDFVGWRQDQSCYHGSVYFKGMHPVLSSSTGELLSGAVDGYFEAWPSTSTVLLNRTKNREAAMLYYPYGNGTVILTSLYTDWGYAHSQATLMELRVVRDLITFAKNPQLPIPMYDLTENVTPSINLNVNIKNNAETPVSKAILKAYTPDRKRVLYTIEQAVGLAPGEEVEIPVQSSSSLVPRPSSLVPLSSVSSVCSVGIILISFAYCKITKGVV